MEIEVTKQTKVIYIISGIGIAGCELESYTTDRTMAERIARAFRQDGCRKIKIILRIES